MVEVRWVRRCRSSTSQIVPPPRPFHLIAQKPPPGPNRSVLSGTIRPVSAYGMRRLARAAATAWMSSPSPTSGSRMVSCWLADLSNAAHIVACCCALASFACIRLSRARTSLAASWGLPRAWRERTVQQVYACIFFRARWNLRLSLFAVLEARDKAVGRGSQRRVQMHRTS